MQFVNFFKAKWWQYICFLTLFHALHFSIQFNFSVQPLFKSQIIIEVTHFQLCQEYKEYRVQRTPHTNPLIYYKHNFQKHLPVKAKCLSYFCDDIGFSSAVHSDCFYTAEGTLWIYKSALLILGSTRCSSFTSIGCGLHGYLL